MTVVASALGNIIPGYGALLGPAAEKATELKKKAVGGNSKKSLDSFLSWAGDEVKGDMRGRVIEELRGSLVSESVNSAASLTGVFDFWGTLRKGLISSREDDAVFNLMMLANISPVGNSVEEVAGMMEYALMYVRANAWFYTDSAYQTWEKNSMGSPIYTNYDPAFINLVRLKKMENDGKSYSEIQLEAERYWAEFNCFQYNKAKSKVLAQPAYVGLDHMPPYRSDVVVFVYGPLYQVILTHYSQFLNQVTRDFKAYMDVGKELNYGIK